MVEGCTNWLREKLRESGANGFVVGLSGGVDSSVTVSLAVKAAGKGNVIGLIMPCESSNEDWKMAVMMAKKLNIDWRSVALDVPYNQLLCRLPFWMGIVDEDRAKIVKGNIKARLRMTTLYAVANTMNLLVLGTGNKTEIVLGYFTKYGDGGCDLLPIGNLSKSEVWELARELDVPEKIINRPPSAGLWEGQTDEDELGLSYEKLDAMLSLIEGDTSETMRGISEWDKVYDMVESAKHKLAMPPIYKGE